MSCPFQATSTAAPLMAIESSKDKYRMTRATSSGGVIVRGFSLG
jgi:hypothetical protein